MAANLPKTETLEHREAWEFYYNLGEKRSTVLVSRQYGKTKGAVDKWSAAFKWQERVIERDNIIADALARKNITETTKEHQAILNACKVGINNFITKIAPGYKATDRIDIRTVSDFERLAKLHLLLTGKATERIESVEVIFSTGEGGENWTKRDATIQKPTNGSGAADQVEAEA